MWPFGHLHSHFIYSDFGGGLDQIYPWVHSNNSFISKNMSLEVSGDV